MEDTSKIFGLPINEFISMIETILIVLSITVIITIQYLKLRKHNELFKKLSAALGITNNKKLNKTEILEKAILSAQQRDINKLKIPENITQFIQSELTNSKVYIHFTSNKLIVDRILKEGFKYSESIYKTSQEVLMNTIDLTYKMQLYRPYGNYLIVICIPKMLFDFAKNHNKSNNQESIIDNILSVYDKHEDLEYTLPSIFIRGYINFENNSIFINNDYLKDFDIDIYKTRISEIIMN